ncbi:SRPBCC family protein [Streptomyces sp. NPDC002187]|uniref:SRPBCC family protein n=1 Tax=Streptomyces sp. NPDC002187 TaxID=3364637 RepID=UPI00367A1AEB
MTVFRITRATALQAQACWLRVTDWSAHAAQMPLTSARVTTPAPAGVGTVFVVRSGIGRCGFDDPMEVVRWEPPQAGRAGVCRLVKRGRVITGWAEVEVIPAGPDGGSGTDSDSGSVVVWTEDLRIRPLPRLLDPLVARVGRRVFGRALDGLLARVPAG